MSTGHTMLAVGAMMLLAVSILGINNKFLNTSTVLYNTKFGVLAVSLGTSIIEEANGKAFDLAGSDDAITNINLLTAPQYLGAASGEVYPNFNDFDDYNWLHKIDSVKINSKTFAAFTIDCRVHYVSESNPSVISSVRTWHKRLDVSVTSESMKNTNNLQDTLRLSSVYSYWHFR
jgi:MSHA pilin protein MshD